MTRYLVERRYHVGQGEVPNVAKRSRQLREDHYPEIIWEHSHVVLDEAGTPMSFCVYEAPDEQTVRRHAEELGYHDIVALYEIAGDVTPEDFPLD
jgi:hypothetical protein